MTAPHILVADDDASIREIITRVLRNNGFTVTATGSAATLWRLVADGKGDLVITDVVMPDGNGLELLPKMLNLRPELKIIAMSAQTTLLTAVKANQGGAFDYIPKPFDLDELISRVHAAFERLPAATSSTAKTAPTPTHKADQTPPILGTQDSLIGQSLAMQEVYRRIARLSVTNLSVLVIGDSGTGKELVASALHDYSNRRTGPFIAVNMAAIPRELIESELFGHEKGAFTGAQARNIGRFEQAQGGTLFLDEIGDMPLEAQTRLLRVLQDGSFYRVGGRQLIRTDTRIVAATNRDLADLVVKGHFREDLYYRLAVAPVHVPPLRARREDIPALATHFLNRESNKTLTEDALKTLCAHHWPGNVRELINVMLRLNALYSEQHIDGEMVRQELLQSVVPKSINSEGTSDVSTINLSGNLSAGTNAEDTLASQLQQAARDYFNHGIPAQHQDQIYQHISAVVDQAVIDAALQKTEGNQAKAATMLGMNRNTLRAKKLRE